VKRISWADSKKNQTPSFKKQGKDRRASTTIRVNQDLFKKKAEEGSSRLVFIDQKEGMLCQFYATPRIKKDAKGVVVNTREKKVRG